jgi:hypothetical protein
VVRRRVQALALLVPVRLRRARRAALCACVPMRIVRVDLALRVRELPALIVDRVPVGLAQAVAPPAAPVRSPRLIRMI